MIDQQCGEQCDGSVNLDCQGSPTGAFVDCSATCTINNSGTCPTTTTTTSSTTTTTNEGGSTTTTTGAPTTTTTLADICPSLCGNGVINVECNEVCDGSNLNGQTCPGEDTGSLVCSADCKSVIDTGCTPPVEICGDCIDNDNNNVTDFEDPECCAGPQQFTTRLVRKARIKTKKGTTHLRLRSIIADSGLSVAPPNADMFLQIRQSGGDEILCARVPQDKIMKMFGAYGIWDKQGLITSAQGVQDMAVKTKKNGTVKFLAFGKNVRMPVPPAGDLLITVGFRNATTGDSSNVCSRVQAPFRTTSSGALVSRPQKR